MKIVKSYILGAVLDESKMVGRAETVPLEAIQVCTTAGFLGWTVSLLEVVKEALPALRRRFAKHVIVDYRTEVDSDNRFEKSELLLWFRHLFSSVG